MALFEVPGWSMPSPPVSAKKRKRGHSLQNSDQLRAAEANVEKLIHSLDAGKNTPDAPNQKKKRKHDRGHSQLDKDLATSSAPLVTFPSVKLCRTENGGGASVNKKKRKGKPNSTVEEDRTGPSLPRSKASTSTQNDNDSGLTSLQKGMRVSLNGARFRWINELLYKSESSKAAKMMKDDSNVFKDYHVGFRYQVQSWPRNPVSHYVSELSSYPPKTVIADLGCGDADLAKALHSKGFNVLSFDLVSDDTFVVEADICSHLPLPGSEPLSTKLSEGEAQIVDVAVCALSLMSTNWPKCISEAWRILHPGGELKIAEVASRFTDVDDFIALIASLGFKLKKKVDLRRWFARSRLTSAFQDDENSHFTLFSFKKVARAALSEKEWAAVMSRGRVLQPCEYKRRDIPNLGEYLWRSRRTLRANIMPGKRNVLSHPLVNARLSQLRLATTSPKDFREGVRDISLVLGIEASRELEEDIFQGQTPVGPFTGSVIRPRIGLTPILRAGLGMADALLTLFPTASVYHLGLFREKVSLQPVEYYSKLPSVPTVDVCFLLDPLVATGGTACAALTMLLDWGIPLSKIKLLVVLGSEEGLRHIEMDYPDLEEILIWVAAVDPKLTCDGLVSPGLGDTGDRLFNT
ncbi:putative uracil phosphoribosyltransferase [Phlebopus sp. FC_14]|nr:putative uracil phosphoribosyltransferase [Phlebopus sp. FC_14]